MTLSIRWKIIVFVILPIVAVYSALMIFNIIKTQKWVTANQETQIKGMAEDYAHRLDGELRTVTQIASLTAAYVEKNPGLSSYNMVSMITTHLEQNPLVSGSAILFAPYAYSPEKRLFVRYVHKENGKLIVSGFVDTGYDYTDPQHEYWHKPRVSGKPEWTEPYFDEGGGNFLMCTYSVPFFKEKKFMGIALVDIPLEPLRQLALQEIPDSVKVDIITPSGSFVYSSDHRRINKPVDEIKPLMADKSLMDFYKTMTSGQTGLAKLSGWAHSEPEVVAYAPIPSTHWGFSVSMTEKQAFKEIQSQFYRNILFFMVSLFFIIPILWFFTARISKSILSLNTTVMEFSKGNLDVKADTMPNDEIGALGDAFNHMATQLLEREDKLFQTQKLFDAVIQQTPIPIMVVPSDKKIHIFNNACRDFLGFNESIIPGIILTDMVPTWKDYDASGNRIHPNNSPLVKALNGISTKNLEMKIIRADGQERWAIANGVPAYDKNGTLIAGIVVFPDITHRKKIEESLRESEERFRRITENAKDMIYRMSLPEGKYQYVSPASIDLYGYTPEEFYITPLLIQDAIHPDWKHYFQKQWENLLNGIMPPNYEYQIIHKSGEVKWLNQRNVLITDKADVPIAIEGIVTDVTEAKLAEEEKAKLEADLRQAQKMEAVGTLAGGIAHDFNNILSAIIGYAELAKDDIPRINPAFEEIEEVINAGKRARDLVKHILAFSRKSGEDRIPLKPLLLVEEALHLIRASIPSTIEIKHDLKPDCGNIMADPTQMHQIIMNICTNAAQAMDENGGTLEVILNEEYISGDYGQETKPFVKLTIKDTGTGIPQDILDRIFDPYFTTKDFGKGSGMGLAIVHGIVEAHNGKIAVESTVGKGTTFHIFFPKITAPDANKKDNSRSLIKGSGKILIVDDETSMANVTMQRLKRLGYHVTVKTDSIEALALFKQDPDYFDLVITDQTMPKMTGEQMVIKMMEIRKGLPVILCTGYSSKIDREKAIALGIKAFMLKPVENFELSKTVREVLAGKEL